MPEITKVEMNIDQSIALMSVYLSEWCYRDESYWNHVYKYFYATLIVVLFPNISSFLSVTIPPLPSAVFRVIGVIMALVLLYVSIGYTKRIEACGKTYQSIIDKFPIEYQRVSIASAQIKGGRFFRAKMSVIPCLCIFISLITIAIALLIIG